jgi:hypothetical protein
LGGAGSPVLYLVAVERRVNRSNPTGRVAGWKLVLNASPSTTATESRPPSERHARRLHRGPSDTPTEADRT